jgi:RNA polymerase sigma-70 factor (ECF subfamily)
MSIACELELEIRERTIVELVVAAQTGDREAFGALFEHYHVRIVALARRRVRDSEEAEELAQEVFMKAMEKIGQLRVPEAFGGWLRRIVDRMAINRNARYGQAMACDPVTLEATCVAADSPEGSAVTKEEAANLRASMNELTPLDRSTLEAFYLRGQSLIEMSNSFEAPVGTIKRRLHVARQRLAKKMDVLQAV